MPKLTRLPMEVEARLTAAWQWWVRWCSHQVPAVRPMRPTKHQACDAILDLIGNGEEITWLARVLALGTRTVRADDIAGIVKWAAAREVR